MRRNLLTLKKIFIFSLLSTIGLYPQADGEKKQSIRILDTTEKRKHLAGFRYSIVGKTKVPIFHWFYQWTSIYSENLSFRIDYQNYYGTTAANPFFSKDFSTLMGSIQYYSNFYVFVQGGGGPFLFFYKFFDDVESSLGIIPYVALGGKSPVFLKRFLFIGMARVFFFSDGYWFDLYIESGAIVIKKTLSLHLHYTARYSLAQDEVLSIPQQKELAQILGVSIAYHW